jgi:hypothetical protein
MTFPWKESGLEMGLLVLKHGKTRLLKRIVIGISR